MLLNIFIVKKLSGENEEESETQETDGLGIQNRDDEDPETITHIPQLSSPVIEPNSNRVQGGVRGNEEESETQENDGLSIQNRYDEYPNTITHVQRLSSSTVKRPNSKHVQAGVRKRGSKNLSLTNSLRLRLFNDYDYFKNYYSNS